MFSNIISGIFAPSNKTKELEPINDGGGNTSALLIMGTLLIVTIAVVWFVSKKL